MKEENTVIKCEGLTKCFDNFTALSKINCSVEDGRIYGMVGSNGAGKSTFLRILSGIYKADAGVCKIDGEDVWENPTVKASIAFVPDDLYFLNGSSMNRMAKMYKSLFPNFDTERFEKMTRGFGLDPRKSMNTFSKGMRRQAVTILALSAKPKYIFFDETFDGLDPVMRNYVKGLICQDVIDRGSTAIITSHSLRELEDTCDQLALLHKGGLVLESDVQNLKTAQFKIQVAFDRDFEKELFDGISIVRFTKTGSVANMIVKGDREEVVSRISALNPILLDVLPLTLEEVFTYEMEALGYTFSLE